MTDPISRLLTRLPDQSGAGIRSSSNRKTYESFVDVLGRSARRGRAAEPAAHGGSKTILASSRDETQSPRQANGGVSPNPFHADAVTATAAAASAPDRAPLDILKDKLAELGIDTSGLTFSEQQFQSSAPDGRTWENHWISVNFGSFTEHYDVAGTVSNPLITATEIQRAKNFVG